MARNALRFARKFHAAELLAGRLFQSEKNLEDIINTIKQTEIYKNADKTLLSLMKLPTSHLQQWVRASWVSDPVASPEAARFVATVVRPAIEISVSAIPEQMVSVMGRYLSILSGQECADELDAASIKVACSALTGDLAHHPLVQGLCLQASRMVEKRKRGLESMVGRRSKETERETALISDAALTLALHSSNAALAKEFGLSSRACKIGVEALKQQSLPMPPVAICFPETVAENFLLADQRYPRADGGPRCAFGDLVFLYVLALFIFVCLVLFCTFIFWVCHAPGFVERKFMFSSLVGLVTVCPMDVHIL